jgi:hypothetical protein
MNYRACGAKLEVLFHSTDGTKSFVTACQRRAFLLARQSFPAAA